MRLNKAYESAYGVLSTLQPTLLLAYIYMSYGLTKGSIIFHLDVYQQRINTIIRLRIINLRIPFIS